MGGSILVPILCSMEAGVGVVMAVHLEGPSEELSNISDAQWLSTGSREDVTHWRHILDIGNGGCLREIYRERLDSLQACVTAKQLHDTSVKWCLLCQWPMSRTWQMYSSIQPWKASCSCCNREGRNKHKEQETIFINENNCFSLIYSCIPSLLYWTGAYAFLFFTSILVMNIWGMLSRNPNNRC